MDVPKFRDGRVHVKNSGVKGLIYFCLLSDDSLLKMYAVFTTYLLVVSVGITLSYPTDVQNWPLLQQIQKQADRLQRTHSNTASNVQALHTGNIAAWNEKADVTSESVVSSSPPPFGTMTNVCDNFCAKWCRKSQLNGERECHYVCTNLCDKKVWRHSYSTTIS